MAKEKLIKLLNEIIEAGKVNTLELDMADFYCGSSCCLCGDWALMFEPNKDPLKAAEYFSTELDELVEKLFATFPLTPDASFIYEYNAYLRKQEALYSDLFTEQELAHPHLNTNHHDREIAHDFIRLVISKIEAL